MKRRLIISIFTLISAVFVTSNVLADARVSDWIGSYGFNHDGHLGTLDIRDSKIDCNTTPWCHLRVSYRNSNGQRYTGDITWMSKNGQNLKFSLNFPGNRQPFNAFIFSWDKSKIAGTTIWKKKTFGFYGIKTPRLHIIQ